MSDEESQVESALMARFGDAPAEPAFEVRVPPRVAEPEPAQVFRTGLRPRPEAG